MPKSVPVIDEKVQITQIVRDPERWRQLRDLFEVGSKASDPEEMEAATTGVLQCLLSLPQDEIRERFRSSTLYKLPEGFALPRKLIIRTG